MIFSGIIGDFFVVNKDVLDYNISTKYCNDCCRNGGMIMYYSPISISGMLILLIVLFFRKNEYTRGLFWALCMIVYGMIVKKFVGPILGWALIGIGAFIIIMEIVAWMTVKFDHDQAGKVNNIIDSMEETRREKEYMNRLENWSKHVN